jgi:glycine C-acetyltransferase
LQTLSANPSLRDQLESNTAYFRQKIAALGFKIKPGVHPIVPVMLFDAQIAQRFAARMNELGVWVTGFFYPVVPMGQARVRVQISAGHTPEILDHALQAFAQVGRELQLID